MAARKFLVVLGAVALVGAAGWYGWQNYGDMLLGKTTKVAQAPVVPKPAPKPNAGNASKMEPSNAAAPTTAAAAPGGPDKLIDELLTASGYKHRASTLPDQIVAGMHGAAQAQGRPAPVNAAELEKVIKESFSSQGFIDRASAELKKNVDEKRLKAVLEMAMTPLAKRMTEMEKAQPSAADMQSFAAKQPSVGRLNLIQRIDRASRSSDLAIEVSLASARGLMSGAAGGDPMKLAKIESDLEKGRAQTIEMMRKNVLVAMSAIYRKASDAELGDYAKMLEYDNAKWLNATLSRTMLEEIKAASLRAGERIASLKQGASTLAKSHETKAPTTATTPNAAVEPPKSAKTAAASPAKKSSRSGQDSRECLNLPTNVEIIKCAEQYR